jgi:hypothetical protein
MDHLLDGGLDELGGVERDGIVETLGKALFQIRHAAALATLSLASKGLRSIRKSVCRP